MNKRVRAPRWTHEEIDALHDLMSVYRNNEAAHRFLLWQEDNPDRDGVDRSLTQVLQKIWKMRSQAPYGDRLTQREWARTLGISRDRLRWAFREKKVRYSKGISRNQMRRMARSYVSLLYGANIEAVREWLGEDMVKVAIAAKPIRDSVVVRNVDTGEKFQSLRSAARASWVDPSSLASAVRNGWRCAGFRWERVS